MFTKDLSVAYLLDFYGDVLSERKRGVLDDYYNNDLSLAEIAQELGISRQGVRDLIKKAEEELNFYEQKLHLAERFAKAGEHTAALQRLSEKYVLPEEITREIRELESCIG